MTAQSKKKVAARANPRKPKAATRSATGKASLVLTTATAKLVARADAIDFRDAMFSPTLVEVPLRMTVDEYRAAFPGGTVPILDQGAEGACTGFGLAAVAHFLLNKRKVDPDARQVSPHMFYDMARRYDEWPGEDYEGSSARGAMKGWHKRGVCSKDAWPQGTAGENHERAEDAASRPLGAYFRVNHRDLVAMHTALAEVGALYASATVHGGWDKVNPTEGSIPFSGSEEVLGGHAFAVVGYDETGFWIQNSWADDWGKSGFARISYADWLKNASDTWVARLGVPVKLTGGYGYSFTALERAASASYSPSELRPHVVALGNNGVPRPGGELGTTESDIERIFREDFPRITKGWKTKRILFYAHGGLVGEKGALQRVEDYREALLENEIYPVAFIWKTDFWSTLTNILNDLVQKRRPEGFLDATKDFMLDRLDDSLEVIGALAGGVLWREMKENAIAATENKKGGARIVLGELKKVLEGAPSLQVHIAGHSAGSVFMAPFIQAITTRKNQRSALAGYDGLGAKVTSATLWAPACTMELFKQAYLPAIRDRSVQSFNLFTLKDTVERDDNCANIYHKSLLYLVSKSFEAQSPLGLFRSTPLLGMEKFIFEDEEFKVRKDDVLRRNLPEVPILGVDTATWIRSPNGLPEGAVNASEARHHGDFDDDQRTVLATLKRILGTTSPRGVVNFAPSSSALADRRRELDRQSRH